MKRIASIALLAATVWTVPAYAQVSRTDDVVTEATPGEQTAGVVPAGIDISASNGDSNISLTFTRRLLPTRWGYTSASLTLTAPIDDGDDEGRFLTQEGFAGKFSAKTAISIVLFGKKPETPGESEEDLRKREKGLIIQIDDACTAKRLGDDQRLLALAATTPMTTDTRNEMEARLDDICQRRVVLRDRRKDLMKEFLPSFDRAELRKFMAPLDGQDLYFINLSTTFGYKRYDYLNPATFAEGKDYRIPFSFSASFGAHFSRNAPFLAVGYEYKRDTKPAAVQIICLPVGPGAPSNCKSGSFAGPQNDNSHNAFALARFSLLTTGDGINTPQQRRVVLGVKVSRDFDGKLWRVSVPLYFMLDSDGGLKGGVRYDWEQQPVGSTKTESRFSIFISKSFDFLGN